MEKEVHFSFDHLGVYQNQKLFFPKISSLDIKENIIVIHLSAKKNDLLNWSDELEKARSLVKQGKFILWKLDLGLEEERQNLDEEIHYLSSQIAVDTFIKEVLPEFQNATFALALYEGSFTFSLFREEESFSNWLDEKSLNNTSSVDDQYLNRHFQAEKIMVYLRLLASRVPDELLIMLFIDFSEITSPAEQFYLFSKECFEYFLLAIKGSILPIEALAWQEGQAKFGTIDCQTSSSHKSDEKIGVVFPQEEGFDLTLFKGFDQLFETLIQENISYRILPEQWATHMWDELDFLIVLKRALSSQVQRILAGFSAAGGKVIILDEKGYCFKKLLQFKNKSFARIPR